MAEIYRRNQRIILDTDLVVVLIPLLKAPEDGNGLCGSRLVHGHHLESSLQCLVRLEILLVLVQSSGTDCPQLAPGQCRLENVGRIHRSGTLSRAHEGMDLIDEEDDLAGAVYHILDHALEPFLKLTLILRTCYEGTHVEGIDLLVLEVLRNRPVHYLLGQALGNRRLAHTWLADEDRIVLGTSAQYLQHPADLLIPAYHRVQLSGRRPFIEIGGESAQEFKLS